MDGQGVCVICHQFDDLRESYDLFRGLGGGGTEEAHEFSRLAEALRDDLQVLVRSARAGV